MWLWLLMSVTARPVSCSGYAYLRKLMFPEAVAEFARLPEGPFSATKWGALGEAYGDWGHVEEARDALQKLDALAGNRVHFSDQPAVCLCGLRDWDRVIEGFEQAYTDYCPGFCLLKVDPRYDPIRSEPSNRESSGPNASGLISVVTRSIVCSEGRLAIGRRLATCLTGESPAVSRFAANPPPPAAPQISRPPG